MNIGKYYIEQMNNGHWMIHWLVPQTRHQQKVFVDNLESVLDEVVKPYMEHQNKLISLFRLAMTDANAFMDESEAYLLLQAMPDDISIPGQLKDPYSQFTWHLFHFIDAYEKIHGIKLKIDDLEPYLNDIRARFK